MKRVTFEIPLEFHRRLKIKAAEAGLSLSAIIRRLLEKWLAGEIGL